MGYRLLQRMAADVAEFGYVESTPKQDGRNMIMVIGPHKKKAEATAEAKEQRQEQRRQREEERADMDAAADAADAANPVDAAPEPTPTPQPAVVSAARTAPAEGASAEV
jgi:translation initiation factor IF-3